MNSQKTSLNYRQNSKSCNRSHNRKITKSKLCNSNCSIGRTEQEAPVMLLKKVKCPSLYSNELRGTCQTCQLIRLGLSNDLVCRSYTSRS